MSKLLFLTRRTRSDVLLAAELGLAHREKTLGKSKSTYQIGEELSASTGRVFQTTLDYPQTLAIEESLSPDFKAEMAAEEFFSNNSGALVRGTFNRVKLVRWEHDETDWDIEVADHTLDLGSTGKSLSLEDVRFSVNRVREWAKRRGWLSEKAIRALENLDARRGKLDRSETNALNYLLEKCAAVQELKDDTEVLRRASSA